MKSVIDAFFFVALDFCCTSLWWSVILSRQGTSVPPKKFLPRNVTMRLHLMTWEQERFLPGQKPTQPVFLSLNEITISKHFVAENDQKIFHSSRKVTKCDGGISSPKICNIIGDTKQNNHAGRTYLQVPGEVQEWSGTNP